MQVTLEFLEGDIVTATYDGAESLTVDQLGMGLAVLLSDTLGDEPQITDVIAIQKSMAGALNPA